MILKTVLIRFYKSFNFDYLRKYHKESLAKPWEQLGDMWYPYVRIPIHPVVTTIVGANESGKSHLLTAVEKGISGKGIEREDFCRHSQFFTVEKDQMRWPDFGFEWTDLSDDEQKIVGMSCGLKDSTNLERFILCRTERDNLAVYIPQQGDEYSKHDIGEKNVDTLLGCLPRVFKIDSHVGLPESVPIASLIGTPEFRIGRENRFQLQQLLERNAGWFKDQSSVSSAAAEISSTISGIFSSPKNENDGSDAELQLARDLILKVANIDKEALEDLYEAIRRGKDGHANGITQRINDALAVSLNFPRWWVQDRDFQLMVSAREHDLVFTIRDRTGTEYSFVERSSGLRYFLSYYIQYLAHEPKGDGREILLMDEPDTYLSSQGQQDLLKIFDAFAIPEDDRSPVQVVYVTHSPFLINKNHGDRIRVLEKGVGDEGTRVVRDVSRNHYEPLRSAFGAFVGETVFIGHCNLMVEGLSDQILLAGVASHLRSLGVSDLQTLDLNQITIVPAGSVSHIPYLVYLARGRDMERPAVIVLLDSDGSGNDAKQALLRGGPRRKQLLLADYILQVGDLGADSVTNESKDGGEPTVIEDLIPVGIAVKASAQYLRDVYGATDDILQALDPQVVRKHQRDGKNCFQAIQAALSSIGDGDVHIDKVGFARNVVEVLVRGNGETAECDDLRENMKKLFTRLREMQRRAERELTTERVSHRVDRAKNAFLRDHPSKARCEQAVELLEEIDVALDDSIEADEIRRGLAGIQRQFKLRENLTLPIDDYPAFKETLERVKYAPRIAVQDPEAEPSSDAEDDPIAASDADPALSEA